MYLGMINVTGTGKSSPGAAVPEARVAGEPAVGPTTAAAFAAGPTAVAVVFAAGAASHRRLRSWQCFCLHVPFDDVFFFI